MAVGTCHCGRHGFDAPEPLEVVRCDCPICTKRGSLVAYYPPDHVQLRIEPAAATAYRHGDRMMTFFHCAVCGCALYSDAPAWTRDDGVEMPARLALNAWLFDDVDIEAFPARRVHNRD